MVSNKKYVQICLRPPVRRARSQLLSTEHDRRHTAGAVIWCKRSATVGTCWLQSSSVVVLTTPKSNKRSLAGVFSQRDILDYVPAQRAVGVAYYVFIWYVPLSRCVSRCLFHANIGEQARPATLAVRASPYLCQRELPHRQASPAFRYKNGIVRSSG